ncbi:hypothetical protein VTK73DRAFT_5999 [Phialemonium thermophilum]|uniref:Uncharacterized protein n=1 Tax=Phialemonium thermophilum TaxID=223376 RepID=A0ABR3V060_9PEZI
MLSSRLVAATAARSGAAAQASRLSTRRVSLHPSQKRQLMSEQTGKPETPNSPSSSFVFPRTLLAVVGGLALILGGVYYKRSGTEKKSDTSSKAA